MKLWLSGEIDYTIGEEFRLLINSIETKLNSFLIDSEYRDLDFSWDVIFIVTDSGGDDVIKYNKRTKESDIRKSISLLEFRNAIGKKREELLICSLINTLQIVNEKYKIGDFSNLYLELNKFLTMDTNLESLKETFERMRKEEFDIESKSLWGFYFIDTDKDKLLDVYNELKDSGYELKSLDQGDDNKWQLFVTKIDLLTPEKLNRRNIAFNELAMHCGIELYDGWDVERL